MDYIVNPILPAGKIHLLSASSGTGKSTLLHQLCDAIRKERLFLGWETFNVPFVYVGGDADRETYTALENDLGIEPLPHVNLMQECISGEMSLRKLSLEFLQDNFFSRHENLKLIILDPADLILGISNFNDKTQVAAGLFKAWKFAKTFGYTIINVLHNNKTKKSEDFLDIFNRIGGSQSIQAYSSTKMIMLNESESESGKVELIIRGKRFPQEKILFSRGKNGELIQLSEEDILREKAVSSTLLFDLVPETFSSSEAIELARTRGISRATTYRHLSQLERLGLISRNGKFFRKTIS